MLTNLQFIQRNKPNSLDCSGSDLTTTKKGLPSRLTDGSPFLVDK
ncbi:hypothetical protein MH1LPH_22360 [Lactiplantibacillus brownii]